MSKNKTSARRPFAPSRDTVPNQQRATSNPPMRQSGSDPGTRLVPTCTSITELPQPLGCPGNAKCKNLFKAKPLPKSLKTKYLKLMGGHPSGPDPFLNRKFQCPAPDWCARAARTFATLCVLRPSAFGRFCFAYVKEQPQICFHHSNFVIRHSNLSAHHQSSIIAPIPPVAGPARTPVRLGRQSGSDASQALTPSGWWPVRLTPFGW
jgi:hypothetical protein